MRKLLALLLGATLSACIPVENWGGYWAKGDLDGRLVGTWKNITQPDQRLASVSAGSDTLRIVSLDSKQKPVAGERPLFAKILRITEGKLFLMLSQDKKGAGGGALVRYKITANKLAMYSLSPEKFSAFLQQKRLHPKNIGVGPRSDGSNSIEVKIGTFDDEVYRVLFDLPEDNGYWSIDQNYRRLSPTAVAPK